MKIAAARGVLSFAVVSLFACGPSTGDSSGSGNADGGGGGTIDASQPSGPDAAACLSASLSAEEVLKPVDIIWVVDTSGSMNDEANAVQDALNDFSSFIAASAVDYRVVLIANASDMNVPPPLGGSTEFLHVNQNVGSTDALQVVYNSYDQYKDFLRPTAKTHFVVVTDDESDWSHGTFDTQIANLVASSFTNYVLHAICSEEQVLIAANPPFPAIMGPCTGGLGAGGAAEFGETYINMASATGGLWSSICSTNWNPIFDSVAAAVSEGIPLPCTYDIPAPGQGEVIDPDRVNFVYQNAAGASETISRVDASSSCSANGGWYYDSPSAPSQIILCPATCDILAADEEGDVEIQFGCATVVD